MLVDYSTSLDEYLPETIFPAKNNYQELQSLITRLDKLEGLKIQELKYFDSSQDAPTKQSINRAIKYLIQEIRDCENSIQNFVLLNESIEKQVELLSSIIGMNERLSWRIIAYLGDSRVHPHERTTQVLKIPKLELQILYKSIYLPTLKAQINNPILKVYSQRLLNQGKTKNLATLTIMKMFLTLSYGVLTSGQALKIQPLSWIKP